MVSANLMDRHLTRVEQQLDHITQALAEHRSDDLVAACSVLQAMMLELSELHPSSDEEYRRDRDLQSRLTRVAAALASRRESVIRHAAMTERALSALVPATQTSTYGAVAGTQARRSYGSVGRQSGEFQTVLA